MDDPTHAAVATEPPRRRLCDRLVARKKVVPGKPDESELFQRVLKDEMPPARAPRPDARDVALLRRWIEAGAPALPAPPRTFVSTSALHRMMADDLRTLGLTRGDVVMVHASVRAVGEVAGLAHPVLPLDPGAEVGTERRLRQSAWSSDRRFGPRTPVSRRMDSYPPGCLSGTH